MICYFSTPLPTVYACCSLRSFAASTTQRENGVPFSPFTCFLLRSLQAWRGVRSSLVAAFAIAVTHTLKGVPFTPFTCFLLSPLQCTPYAFAFSGSVALGPGGVGAVGS